MVTMKLTLSLTIALALSVSLIPGSATSASPKREVVLFWGQNTARLPERDLRYFCESGQYDTVIVSYITQFFADKNTRYPGLNLAVHCGKVQNKAYPGLFKCGGIGLAIKFCQDKGIKVLLGIRGEKGEKHLKSKRDAEIFADRIWKLFLGGKHSLRPFGDYVMDGINLSIRTGDDKYYAEMLDQFNLLFATDRARNYLITAAPECRLPMTDFKTVIEERMQYFDAIYLQHSYGEDCHPTGDTFGQNLEMWTKKVRAMNGITFRGTKFYLVLVLSLELKYYMTLWKDFEPIYKKTLKDIPEFGGVCLADAGWDDRLHVMPEDERYSTLVHKLFNPPEPVTLAPGVTTTTTTTPPPPLNLKVGALWGSNLAYGKTDNTEPSLRIICEKALYDTVIINTLDDDASDQNKGNLPGLNFASHCFTPFGPKYKSYLRCNTIGHDIRYCQQKKIKVLLNIGGSTKFIGFQNRNASITFAHNIWKLFLGGVAQASGENLPRTFGTTVLDGVNIEVRFGQPDYIVDFVRELRRITRAQKKQHYLITANPNCVHPSFNLDESFKNEISAFDHLFVNFDDQSCTINKKEKFESSFQVWYDYAIKEGGPMIWVGLAADPRNTRDPLLYLARVNARQRLVRLAETYSKFGGVLLNDASWDAENLINSSPYSQFLASILRPGRIPGRKEIITQAPTTTLKDVGGGDGGDGGSDGGDGEPKVVGPTPIPPKVEIFITWGGSAKSIQSNLLVTLILAISLAIKLIVR